MSKISLFSEASSSCFSGPAINWHLDQGTTSPLTQDCWDFLQRLCDLQCRIFYWRLGSSRQYVRMDGTLSYKRQGFFAASVNLGKYWGRKNLDEEVQRDVAGCCSSKQSFFFFPPAGQAFIYERTGGRLGLRSSGHISGRSDVWIWATVVLFPLSALAETAEVH